MGVFKVPDTGEKRCCERFWSDLGRVDREAVPRDRPGMFGVSDQQCLSVWNHSHGIGARPDTLRVPANPLAGQRDFRGGYVGISTSEHRRPLVT